MATHLDLEEQEQLDQIKHYWKQYGNAVTWVLIVALGAYAAWSGFQYWQRSQAAHAAVLYDEMERAAQAQDVQKAERILEDLRIPDALLNCRDAASRAAAAKQPGQPFECPVG